MKFLSTFLYIQILTCFFTFQYIKIEIEASRTFAVEVWFIFSWLVLCSRYTYMIKSQLNNLYLSIYVFLFHYRSTPRPRPKNPCSPSPCGPGTTCTPSPSGNPICRCQPGLIPKPDTITGCGPECVRDPDCQYGLVCQNQRCVEKPDPCNPSPCGPGATCSPNSIGNPICR